MPITTHYHERGVLRAEWLEDVTIEEVIDSMASLVSMMDEHEDEQAVIIVDLISVKSIPFDIGNLRRVADMDSRIVSYVVVDPPLAAQIILNMLKKLSIRTFHHAPNLGEGLALSKHLLQSLAVLA